MTINQLIYRNLKKNIRHYYLYVFALIFSAGLYFAFVTLQYDPALDATKGTLKGGAAIRAASVLLIFIVAVFLLYANSLFIKQRSKEIGLFQLIGMTKRKVFYTLSAENAILYMISLLMGVIVGFISSKLLLQILFKITNVEAEATLQFSGAALVQTIIVFLAIYVLIMLMNFSFIKRQTILALFRVTASSEVTVRKLSVFQVIIGIAGIAFIAAGYYISSMLFDGDFTTMVELYGAMIFVLFSVILGTYLFYKGSVAFIVSLIRKQKGGYLNIKEVLSLSSVMFRMKSNAVLLTIITTVSALAIGLLSLTYITYFSAEKTADNYTGSHDFSMVVPEDKDAFTALLDQENIDYEQTHIPVITTEIKVADILGSGLEMGFETETMLLPVISAEDVDVEADSDETVFTGYSDMLQRFMSLKDSGQVELIGNSSTWELEYKGLEHDYYLSNNFTLGGLPTAIVSQTVWDELDQDTDQAADFYGIDVTDNAQLTEANHLFERFDEESEDAYSRQEVSTSQKSNVGLIMFIVGFLGLAFLITSGCIIYFKQMGESEDEKPNYTILRKLGFTETDLSKGIQRKQLFNFGIPLIIGLLHGYFAVQSGWFLFGSVLWTPMIVVMIVYTVLYSVFGILTVLYYKKVIRASL